jgi:hypothetical protein
MAEPESFCPQWRSLAPYVRVIYLNAMPTLPAGPERLALSKTVWV